MKEGIVVNQHDIPPVVAIDLGGTQLRIAVLIGAELLVKVSTPTGDNPIPDCIIPRIFDGIQQVLQQAHITSDQVVGIGVSIAGPLDSHRGIIFTSPNLPGWNHIRLKDILHCRYSIPIIIENDANAATFGEYAFGAGRGYNNLVYLTISTGIGGGIIVDNQIVRGASGTAGELGHIVIDRNGEQCNCGNIGCLESIASGSAIARRANRAIATHSYFKDSHSNKQRSYIDAQLVAKDANDGIPAAQAIIADAAEALGVGLVDIIHIFNPEVIILDGGVAKMGSLLLEPALRTVQKRTMSVPKQAVHILPAELDGNGGLLGAGALVYRSIREDFFLPHSRETEPLDYSKPILDEQKSQR